MPLQQILVGFPMLGADRRVPLLTTLSELPRVCSSKAVIMPTSQSRSRCSPALPWPRSA